ncbi:fungal specific transcription factor domain-containing protein 74 [Elsinoe australis]|uniref:Fungal specific transcription factor domain-containing protein 74 n=1 Tax=Elsinoe australis TaxID=40998 RepID=A0A4U7ANC3_9PEZI|nr:fungal specific transcription factor domain-containing protein 74 [Elsinoe australis]
MTSAFAPNSFGMDGHYGYMQPPPGAYYHEDESPMISPDVYGPQLHQLNTLSTESLHQYGDYDDSSLSLCDEAHPTCERCRKGKRECVYPDPSSLKQVRDPSKIRSVPADSVSNSSGDEEGTDSQKLPPIPDEDEGSRAGPPSSEPSSAISGPVDGMQLPAHDSMSPSSKEKSPTSPVDTSRTKRPHPGRSASKSHLRQATLAGPKWAKLPKDVRFYMKYHRHNISCHHYALKYDGSGWLKDTFLEIALSYEPLLYAITAFSAYFHTLTLPDGKISMFLGYYNKSVETLRATLARSSHYNTATLLTILQLATFEEYLGDWVNVMSHQRAAKEILTQLFTPSNIMMNETKRKIITWYLRFDIVTGLVSGEETVLGREWHSTVTNYYIRQEADHPSNLGSVFEASFAKSRLLATDIASLFGKKGKGVISDEKFNAGVAELKRQMDARDAEVNNAFASTRSYISSFPNAPTDNSHDIVDSTSHDYLIAGDLWTWNLVMVDWWAIQLVFIGQLYQLDKSVNPIQLVELSYKICRMFEGMEFAAKENQSAILGAHASLGIAATALPKDQKHSNWCRRKFAVIERNGYVYPPSFRTRMSNLWSADVNNWWLDDDELLLPILRQIREFINDRTLNPETTQSISLREMRAIFEAMTVEEGDTRAGGSAGSVGPGVEGEFDFGMGGMEGSSDRIEAGSWGMGSSPDVDWGLVTSGEVGQGEWGSVIGGPSPERGA